MSVAWGDYEIYDPGVMGPPSDLSRSDARKAYNKLMAEKDSRIEVLRRLLAANEVALREDDTGLQSLNSWYLSGVQADPGNPARLAPEWYSVSGDVALFLGDVIISRCPGLRWEFYTWGKKNVSYQKSVIMGFTRWSNPKINLDLGRRVTSYGQRKIYTAASVGFHGKVTVRGVEIDLDAHAADRLKDGPLAVEPDLFVWTVKWAEDSA